MTTKEHYEAAIGTLEYWNNCGSEWNYSTINDKIFKIALCVKFKGVLYRVVNKYAKGREYADRRAIQWCILRYLSTLMGSDYYPRIMLLDNKEAVKLLSNLLNVAKLTMHFDATSKNPTEPTYKWELNKEEADSILVAIENEHKQKYPNETLADQKKLVRKWKDGCWWRK